MRKKKKETKKKEKKSGISFGSVFFSIIMIIGIGLMLYPSITNLVNEGHQTVAIADYDKVTESLSEKEKEKIWNEALEYNQLLSSNNVMHLNKTNEAAYQKTLNITGTGIMGYIKIPKCNIELPIYHGTSKEILQVGVGHLEGTSLPVGGKGTHCAVSGHTGLPSSKMFNNITELKEGDLFIIKTLGKTLTYKVDNIKVVLPNDAKSITRIPGKDYCTLITCTPYGVNSHRLLVRGHRTKNIYPEPNVSKVDKIAIMMILIGIIMLVSWFWSGINKKRKRKKMLE